MFFFAFQFKRSRVTRYEVGLAIISLDPSFRRRAPEAFLFPLLFLIAGVTGPSSFCFFFVRLASESLHEASFFPIFCIQPQLSFQDLLSLQGLTSPAHTRPVLVKRQFLLDSIYQKVV